MPKTKEKQNYLRSKISYNINLGVECKRSWLASDVKSNHTDSLFKHQTLAVKFDVMFCCNKMLVHFEQPPEDFLSVLSNNFTKVVACMQISPMICHFPVLKPDI